MNEAIRSLVMAVWMVCAVNTNANASETQLSVEEEALNNNQPTVVWGEAKEPDGGENEAIVEQAPNEGNPLGSPILEENNMPPAQSVSSASQAAPVVSKQSQGIAPIVQSTDQGIWRPGEVPLPQPSNKIENEIYQSGNDILDVQAYPIKDVSTVTEPNLQPTIITQ